MQNVFFTVGLLMLLPTEPSGTGNSHRQTHNASPSKNPKATLLLMLQMKRGTKHRWASHTVCSMQMCMIISHHGNTFIYWDFALSNTADL